MLVLTSRLITLTVLTYSILQSAGDDLSHLVVYFVGPLVGAVLGVVVYDLMKRGRAVAGSPELGGV